GLRPHCRFGRLVSAPQRHCLWRAARSQRQDASLVSSDVCTSGIGVYCRYLSASRSGRLVSERREAFGLNMPTLIDTIAGRRVDEHRRCPRIVVDEEQWRLLANELAAGRYALLGLWAERQALHMLLFEGPAAAMAVATIECPRGRFPSVGSVHPPAIRLERGIRSLFGLEAVGLADQRPWLDLGFWEITNPLAASPAHAPALPYVFLPAEGEGLHQIPVGPVHAGIIEPGHFRFTANGETVVRLEERLGYVHKGTEALMQGATLDRARRLAGRTSGDSTVAYALAFAHAVESAWDVEVPSRALYLRALMAELERLANHFGDIGAICNDASFSLMH